ncbi:uncharacterized protein BT62DRAFT_940797 [Guyanagaster necrorhizus]|uniref:Uncharacterized protein n=1 Tax=Guyanagaster necrorhizus TaxID=856835 RepID=A0A9P8AY33_9AGAR|nr:uncharacterized protein BT62DRAFT_940797 [Guyanagaster necrorhizus MCA 3950]KAG7451836.1 hypothetical protein BT62DRAFT_940797 [Guyanagaster necrorhizus MCA 3950]
MDEIYSLGDTLDSPDVDYSSLLTPTSIMSGSRSATLDGVDEAPDVPASTQKKKKKKKSKKSTKAKSEAPKLVDEDRPPVLCISRNKHWRYISSYHGPWLQLPIELLESLLVLNLDPATLSATEPRIPSIPPTPNSNTNRIRDRSFRDLNDFSPPDSPRASLASLPLPPPIPPPQPGKATPPPIDPGVFRNVTSIRRLIDEAAELSVRASSGLSAAELGSMRGGSVGLGGSPWAAAQTLGINPLGNVGGTGRNVAMSAMRIHRLRALAVQKLAQAYKADEIASSVMVMQGGSVFDDVAERVLKVDPNDADAKYVHFFHEKIPSRQLAESTTTEVLDELIRAQPQRLEFYRTRGIVRCFRDEYPEATRDFTYALKESRAAWKAKVGHTDRGGPSESRTKSSKKRKSGSGKTNGQAPPSGTSTIDSAVEGPDGEPLLIHPSVLPDAPDPIEPQLLFLRGAAYLQHAIYLIEGAVLQLEGIRKAPSIDGAELRLCYLENGKYGGVEIGHPDGPLGKMGGAKVRAYRDALGEGRFKDQVTALLKKSIRDHDKFLAHFDTLESSNSVFDSGEDVAKQVEYAFLLSESIRPGNHSNGSAPAFPLSDAPAMFTTYHPLLVESHFSVLICQLMLADFSGLLKRFIHTAALVDGLEGYPVFLPPRSMAQAEFIEVLERLAGGWKNGIQLHSLCKGRAKGRLAIEARPVTPPPAPIPLKGGSSSTAGAGSSRDDSSSSGTGSPPPSLPGRQDADEALDCARILLAPVVHRQRERAEKAAAEKAAGPKKKPLQINIPLHGPRVEVILAWLGAVHLPELD